MTYTEIQISSSKETVDDYGLKSWIKIGITAQLSENETPMDVFLSAKKEIENMHSVATPVRVVESDKEDSKKFNEGLALVIARLNEFQYKEDAQEYTNALPDYKEHYSVKIKIAAKPCNPKTSS